MENTTTTDQEIKEAARDLIAKLGTEIVTEAELSDRFLNRVILPYLRQKIGLLADAKLERRIKRGRYDVRIGSLLIEFERPKRGIREGIKQGKRYVQEFKEKGKSIRCFITDGLLATFVDEYGKESQIRTSIEIVPELLEHLSVLALMPAEPEDLLRVLGPTSDICRYHVKRLIEIFKAYKDLPFVDECYDLWRRVYGAAANLSPDVVKAVRKYAKNMDIELESREDVEEFLFIIETYLSVLMKLLIASIAVNRRLVEAPKLSELLSPPLASFEKLSIRIPFLGKAFEHDAFSWFIDAARRDIVSSQSIADIIGNISLALDRIDLSKVRIDLLRRVYQHFFDPQTRKALGEFYTNEEIVGEILDTVGYLGDHIVDKKLLDMACGSGTFLIVAIKRFIDAGRSKELSNIEILERLQTNVVGIDIHPFAVAMARVNYLLAITSLIDPEVRRILGEFVVPIYWTDSLASFSKRPEPTGIPVIEVDVSPLGSFTLPSHQELKWDYLLDITRKAVDENWEESRYLQEFHTDIVLKYKDTLIGFFRKFKQRAKEGRDSRWLSTLRNVVVVDRLKGRCDFVTGNPPWVRIHNVDAQLRRRIGEKYSFYGKKAGWNPRFKKTKIPFREQVDYSIAFVEAAIDYLNPGGFFGFVITSNVVRSLYAGNMRRKLLQETTILNITDYSLSRIQLFEGAQNAPLTLTFVKSMPPMGHKVKVKLVNRLSNDLSWEIEQDELPLVRSDYASPWILAPPEIVSAMRKMQKVGPRLGDVFSINMGIKTAANDIFYIKHFEPTDSPRIILATMTSDRKERIEKEMLRPLVRGRDVDAWHYGIGGYIIWTHDDVEGEVLAELPESVKAYFEKNEIKEVLSNRSDYESGQPIWIIFRVSREKLTGKVAWQKIAKFIEATYIPSEHENKKFGSRKLIVDSSIYFVGVEDVGLELAGILNSTPVRVYSGTFVNRTGAAYCQFFAWIMGLIHVPKVVIVRHAEEIAEFAQKLHEIKGSDSYLLTKLDEVAANLYGLSKDELSNMRSFFSFFAAG